MTLNITVILMKTLTLKTAGTYRKLGCCEERTNKLTFSDIVSFLLLVSACLTEDKTSFNAGLMFCVTVLRYQWSSI